MPSLEASLVSKLKSDATLAALVSNRIFPAPLRELRQLPCVTYIRISTIDFNTFASSPDFEQTRFQITAIAEDSSGISGYDTARDIIRAVKLALRDYVGGSIQACLLAGGADSYNTETGWYTPYIDVILQGADT